MDATSIGFPLITSGSALAGLILVFLGQVFTAFNSYNETEKKSVRSTYQRRGVIAFVGFVAAILTVALGFASAWAPSIAYVGLASLAGTAVATIAVATISVKDLFQ